MDETLSEGLARHQQGAAGGGVLGGTVEGSQRSTRKVIPPIAKGRAVTNLIITFVICTLTTSVSWSSETFCTDVIIKKKIQQMQSDVADLLPRVEGELAQRFLNIVRRQIEFLDGSGKVSTEELALFGEFVREIYKTARRPQSPPANDADIRFIKQELTNFLHAAQRPQAKKLFQTAINHLELLGDSGKISEEMVSVYVQYREEIQMGLNWAPGEVERVLAQSKEAQAFLKASDEEVIPLISSWIEQMYNPELKRSVERVELRFSQSNEVQAILKGNSPKEIALSIEGILSERKEQERRNAKDEKDLALIAIATAAALSGLAALFMLL